MPSHLVTSMKQIHFAIAFFCLGFSTIGLADDKSATLQGEKTATTQPDSLFARPEMSAKTAKRITVGEGDNTLPLIVVRGTPYEMGYQLGQALKTEMHQFIPAAMNGILAELKLSQADLIEVWARTAAFADDRVEQELAGLADGSGLPLSTLQAVHTLPLLMPYSCSSIAVWGKATVDGHLYQTRNLDWDMKVGAHNFPAVVMYLPNEGIPHIIPSFAGIIGAHTGMNTKGIALAEMGDAAAAEAPYQVHAPHFTIFFRTMLYDADSLTHTLNIFKEQPMTKRYHFVFGDGQKELRAVKIRAHSPEPSDKRLAIWTDNDPKDEFAPNVTQCLVYNDEGRGAFPLIKKSFGKIDGEQMVALANQIPIKGSNVINIVYDATALRAWVSYAKGNTEAYLRPYVYIDLKKIDSDHNGISDLDEQAKVTLGSN